MSLTDKELFINYLKILYGQRNFSLAKISKDSKINYERLRRLNIGRSSANGEDLKKLIKAYPELTKKEEQKKPPIDSAVDNYKTKELEDRIAQLERQVIKILNQLDTLKA